MIVTLWWISTTIRLRNYVDTIVILRIRLNFFLLWWINWKATNSNDDLTKTAVIVCNDLKDVRNPNLKIFWCKMEFNSWWKLLRFLSKSLLNEFSYLEKYSLIIQWYVYFLFKRFYYLMEGFFYGEISYLRRILIYQVLRVEWPL